jgi:pyridoxamine 5'-phosphate oxidase
MTGAPVTADPLARFAEILERAKQLPRDLVPEPTAFALATVDDKCRPSVRIVLLKGVDPHGFVFYTNVESRKGRELAESHRAALCFHWQALDEQVRVEGTVDRVSDDEADAYFATRPRGSQVGAWASIQSRPIEHAGDLEARLTEVERRYDGRPVPRPPHWSGFRVVPERIEFWKGMPSRLHVRELFVRGGAGWKSSILYP